MGELAESSVDKIRDGAFNILSKLVVVLDTISIYELYYFIIVLGQYLYARYATEGEYRKGKYIVYSSTVAEAISDDKFSEYAKWVIQARNTLCHKSGCEEEMFYVSSVADDRVKLKSFMAYLGFEVEEKKSEPAKGPTFDDALAALLEVASIS